MLAAQDGPTLEPEREGRPGPAREWLGTASLWTVPQHRASRAPIWARPRAPHLRQNAYGQGRPAVPIYLTWGNVLLFKRGNS